MAPVAFHYSRFARGGKPISESATKPPRAGRPTKEQAEARQAQLLDAALDLFLEQGFEQTTIEAIAAHVNMTKRTIYARYEDKRALFLAAVDRAIDRSLVPEERLAALDLDDLAGTLRAVAMMRVENVMTPQGLRLQRIINTESYRFPEIFMRSYERSGHPPMQFVARLLRRHCDTGTLAIDDPQMAASIFMTMVVSGPVRIIVSGNPMPWA